MGNERKETLQQEQQQGLGDNADVAQPDDSDVDVQDVERNDAGFFPTYQDHFLLRQPTSDVRFRGNAVRVYQLRTSQIQWVAMKAQKEDAAECISDETAQHQVKPDPVSNDHSLAIEIKEVMADRAVALSLLRTTYTLVALFFTGIVSHVGHQFTLAVCSVQ
jgi:hypothetical protein